MAQHIANVPLKDLYGTNPVGNYANSEGGFAELISAILPNFIIIGAFILFLYMVFGGFMIVSSSGDSKTTDEGKTAITNAIIGYVIIFISYWIIQIIETITGLSIL